MIQKYGPMVLGIIGSVLVLLMWLPRFLSGPEPITFTLGIVIPIIGIVGGVLVKSKALLGGILMLASAIALIVLLGINHLSLFPGVPLFIGGIGGLASSKKTA